MPRTSRSLYSTVAASLWRCSQTVPKAHLTRVICYPRSCGTGAEARLEVWALYAALKRRSSTSLWAAGSVPQYGAAEAAADFIAFIARRKRCATQMIFGTGELAPFLSFISSAACKMA